MRDYEDLTDDEQRRMEELWDLESDLKSQVLNAKNKLVLVQEEIKEMHKGGV